MKHKERINSKMTKKIELNKVTKVKSIKEMLDLAVKEAGNKNAFEYKNGDKIKFN